jgi:hypothetical protein
MACSSMTLNVARSRSSAGRRRAGETVDSDSGNEGGTTEGVFISEWKGDVLYGRNEAVGGHYILAYARMTLHRRMKVTIVS